MHFTNKHINQLFFFSLLLFFPGCGRKQQSIFSFEEKKKKQHKRLSLPAPKLIEASSSKKLIRLRWLVPYGPIPCNSTLSGYILYGVSNNNLVNRQSYAILDATKTSLEAPLTSTTQSGFLIRGLFTQNNHTIEGTSSNIIHLKKVPPT